MLLKRGEQPAGFHAARQDRLRALSKGGDLMGHSTGRQILRRIEMARFPVCDDSVTLGPILGLLTGLLPRDTSMTLPFTPATAGSRHAEAARDRSVAGTAHQLQKQHSFSVCFMCAALPRWRIQKGRTKSRLWVQG